MFYCHKDIVTYVTKKAKNYYYKNLNSLCITLNYKKYLSGNKKMMSHRITKTLFLYMTLSKKNTGELVWYHKSLDNVIKSLLFVSLTKLKSVTMNI